MAGTPAGPEASESRVTCRAQALSTPGALGVVTLTVTCTRQFGHCDGSVTRRRGLPHASGRQWYSVTVLAPARAFKCLGPGIRVPGRLRPQPVRPQ